MPKPCPVSTAPAAIRPTTGCSVVPACRIAVSNEESRMGRTRMIARRIAGLFAASLVVLGFLAPAAAEPVKLSLLHINDIDRIEDLDGRGGLARLMTLVHRERDRKSTRLNSSH